MFNYINNIEICRNMVDEIVPVDLVYYSHIILIVVSLLLGFFVFLKTKNLVTFIIFLISIVFSLWLWMDVILWTSTSSQNYMFFWSIIILFEYLLFVLFLSLIINFKKNKKDTNHLNFIWLILLLPLSIFIPTKYNISNFDISYCMPIENMLYSTYNIPLYWAMLILLVVISFRKIKSASGVEKKQIKLFAISSCIFLFVFIISNNLASYFMDNEILSVAQAYNIEMYSLFLMLLFFSFLSYSIVRFRAFNIKLLASQALVWVMVILIGAQFLFIESTINIILNSVTFIAISVAGLILVRSVKQVDTQRELLSQANQNQESLLHFITHQVKAYMTKSRNIFDGLVQGDYGQLPEKADEMARYGFDSETRGVETVQAILRASDLKSGRTEFRKQKTNISALVAEIVENREDQAHKKNLELTFDIEPNIEIMADPIQIKEVFKNIITNAVIYTQAGTVHIELKRLENKIRFAVIDTGFGLTPEDKSKLFKEGGKSMDSLSVNVESTGYGLFIAKQIVHKHGGTIGAKSQGRNKGSEFFVLLPDVG